MMMIRIIIPIIALLFILNFSAVSVFAVPNAIKLIEELEKKTQERKEPLREGVAYTAGGLRDPFKWLITGQLAADERGQGETVIAVRQAQPPPPLTVQGVIWGGVLPQAIVNNQVVKADDVIEGGVKIINIAREGIKIFFDGRQYNLIAPAGEKCAESVEKTRRRRFE